MVVENKIPLIFELPVDRSRETPAILIEKKWKRERGEAFNWSPNLLSLSTNRDPTEFIKPGARTHEPGTREITDAPRSFSLSLSLLSFFSPSLSVARDRFHGEHFQLSIVRTFLDTPFGIRRSAYLRFWSPLSAALPTDSRCLPRQRDWNLFIALADRHSRPLIGGSNRGTPRRGSAVEARRGGGGGESTQTLPAVIILICGGGTTVKNVDGHAGPLPSVIIGGGGWPPLSIIAFVSLPPWFCLPDSPSVASTLSRRGCRVLFLHYFISINHQERGWNDRTLGLIRVGSRRIRIVRI